jgi:hypothetical protein
VVWQGSAGDRRPYADQTALPYIGRARGAARTAELPITPVKRRPRNEWQSPESPPPLGVPEGFSQPSPATYFSPAIQSRRRPFNPLGDTPLSISRKRAFAGWIITWPVGALSCISHSARPQTRQARRRTGKPRGYCGKRSFWLCASVVAWTASKLDCALRIEGNDRPETRCRTEGIDRRTVFLSEFLQPARLALSFSAKSIRQSHRGTDGQPGQSRLVTEQEKFSLSAAPDVAKEGGRVKR